MAHSPDESMEIKKIIDDWFDSMANKNPNGALSPISDDFVSHMSGSQPFVGKEGLWGIIEAYKSVMGPIYHTESKITVSSSSDLAYEIGRHDHVMYDGKGGSQRSSNDHIIVLRKIDGKWLIVGISETKSKPSA